MRLYCDNKSAINSSSQPCTTW